MENSAPAHVGEPDIADDILKGARSISGFLGPEFSERTVYHLAENKALPIFRLPGSATLLARKSELRSALRAGA